MAVAIGTKLSVKSSTTQVYHSWFLCVLTTICYIELCLLFEFGLGKLIRAGALAAESCCQEVCLKKIYRRTPQHRYFAIETQFRIYVHACAQAHKGRLFLQVLINYRGSLYNQVWLPVYYMLKLVKVNSAFTTSTFVFFDDHKHRSPQICC